MKKRDSSQKNTCRELMAPGVRRPETLCKAFKIATNNILNMLCESMRQALARNKKAGEMFSAGLAPFDAAGEASA